MYSATGIHTSSLLRHPQLGRRAARSAQRRRDPQRARPPGPPPAPAPPVCASSGAQSIHGQGSCHIPPWRWGGLSLSSPTTGGCTPGSRLTPGVVCITPLPSPPQRASSVPWLPGATVSLTPTRTRTQTQTLSPPGLWLGVVSVPVGALLGEGESSLCRWHCCAGWCCHLFGTGRSPLPLTRFLTSSALLPAS